MDRILQTNSQLSWRYNRYGCLYRSVLAIPEEEMGRCLKIADLNTMELDHVRETWVNDKLGLNHERSYIEILGDGFARFDVVAGGNQMGMFDGALHWWGTKPIQWDYQLVNYAANTSDGHWMLHDAYGKLLFNPDPSLNVRDPKQIFYVTLWGV